MENKFVIFCKSEDGKVLRLEINPNETINDLIKLIKKKVEGYSELKLYKTEKKEDKDLLNISLTINQCGLKNKSTVYAKIITVVILEGQERKVINIKFFKDTDRKYIPNSNVKLTSLLKLSLLKEISAKIDLANHQNLPELTKAILEILKEDFIPQTDNMKEDIKKVIENIKGSNIINFSKFVDNAIDSNQIDNLMNLLSKKDLLEITDIKNRLSRYDKEIKVFDKQFSEALKDSIIEFSAISVAVIERKDLAEFDTEKKKCDNRVDKLLFHGTGEEAVASILTTEFWKSEKAHYQHGKGVYFSDKIDYCWFYGNKDDNRINMNKIPQKDETFTMIACSVYYDKNHFHHV